MSRLAENLLFLFPDIDLSPDSAECVLCEVNGSQEITLWGRLEPQPTQNELDNAAIQARRLVVCAAINAERDRREQSTFPYLGKRIDSYPVSVQRISVAATTAQLALAADVPFSIEWACADNSILALDAMGVLGMVQALGSHGLALHMFARGLKTQAMESETPETIDILTGWPE